MSRYVAGRIGIVASRPIDSALQRNFPRARYVRISGLSAKLTRDCTGTVAAAGDFEPDLFASISHCEECLNLQSLPLLQPPAVLKNRQYPPGELDPFEPDLRPVPVSVELSRPGELSRLSDPSRLSRERARDDGRTSLARSVSERIVCRNVHAPFLHPPGWLWK